MKILGIDLSLTGTGLAILTDGPPYMGALYQKSLPNGLTYYGFLVAPPKSDDPFPRWSTIGTSVVSVAGDADMIVIEGYAFGANHAYARAIAELGGIVRYRLRENAMKYIEVPPTQLKKFVLGKGVGEKALVLKEVYKRWGVDLTDDNMADAFVLAKIGEVLTWSNDGEITLLNQASREVIAAIKNPKPKSKKKSAA